MLGGVGWEGEGGMWGTYEAVHLVECTEDVDAFGLVPREPLGTGQAVLRSEFVGQRDGAGTYVQSAPQRISLFLGAHGRAVLGAGVNGHGYVADQAG